VKTVRVLIDLPIIVDMQLHHDFLIAKAETLHPIHFAPGRGAIPTRHTDMVPPHPIRDNDRERSISEGSAVLILWTAHTKVF